MVQIKHDLASHVRDHNGMEFQQQMSLLANNANQGNWVIGSHLAGIKRLDVFTYFLHQACHCARCRLSVSNAYALVQTSLFYILTCGVQYAIATFGMWVFGTLAAMAFTIFSLA